MMNCKMLNQKVKIYKKKLNNEYVTTVFLSETFYKLL